MGIGMKKGAKNNSSASNRNNQAEARSRGTPNKQTLNRENSKNQQSKNTKNRDAQHRDTQYRNTQYRDAQHRDTQYRDTQHRDARHRDARHRDAQSSNRNLYNNDYDDFYEEEDFISNDSVQPSNQNKTFIIIGAIVIAVILIIIAFFYLMNSKDNQDRSSIDSSTEQILEDTEYSNEEYDEDTSTEDHFQIGGSTESNVTYEEGQKTTIETEHSSSTDFLKDLDGNEISESYTVQNVTHEVDYANYEEKRATIDDGMEFYWVELDYKGKKYRAQCSYNMYRQLESSGICKVAIEILTLDTGQQAISYMKVIPDVCTVDDINNNPYF